MPLEFLRQAEALYQALQPDPYFAALESWVTVGSPRQAMLAYYDFSMREARTYGYLFLPAGTEHGVSIWLKPLTEALAEGKRRLREQFIAEQIDAEALDRYRQIMALMTGNAEPLIDDQAWYLSIIGVLPEFQNQGLGASLVEPVLAESDRLGVATYLETFTPRNKPFYARLGYEDAGTFAEPVTGASYSLMIRPAAG